MKLLILDNYDSFTYNLSHYAEQFCEDVTVVRNDEITLDEVAGFDKVILSPGPGLPADAGIMMELIARYGPSKAILGICLGMQGMVECYGGKLHNMDEVKHGLQRDCIHLGNDDLYRGVPNEFKAGRYHSWAVKPDELGEMIMTARDEDGVVMSCKHPEYDVRGVQYHPESIMTPDGITIVENWIRI